MKMVIVTIVTVCILERLGRVVRMNGYRKANQEQGLDDVDPCLRNGGIQ
jgi:hypothetical protein